MLKRSDRLEYYSYLGTCHFEFSASHHCVVQVTIWKPQEMPPFSSPQGNAPQTLAALWTLACIAFIFVCLRLYTRYRVVDAIGIDDHLLNTAFVSSTPSY